MTNFSWGDLDLEAHRVDEPAMTWLVEKATERERERIIKLLESIAITTKNDEVAVMELLSAIVELIKGENK